MESRQTARTFFNELRSNGRLEILPAHGGAPTPLFRLAVTLWIVFCVVCGCKALISPVKHNSFHAFQIGTELWLADLDPYLNSFYEFRYGPAFAELFTPLMILPERLASLAWMWLNLGVFLWSLRILMRDILPLRWTPDREGIFLLLVMATAYRGLWSAQTNGLIFACVVAAMQAILLGRWTLAAVCLAFPVHIKIWPIAAALLLVSCWPRRLAARFCLALTAIGVIPLLTKSWPVLAQRYADWFGAIWGPMQKRHDYHDAWTMWEIIATPTVADYALLQLSGALFVFALCLWQRQKCGDAARLCTFVLGMWTSWQLVLGPGTERNTFCLLSPLAAWGVVSAFSMGRGQLMTLCAYALTFLASIGQFERALAGVCPLVSAAHPIGVCLFALWLVNLARGWEPTRADQGMPTAEQWLSVRRDALYRRLLPGKMRRQAGV